MHFIKNPLLPTVGKPARLASRRLEGNPEKVLLQFRKINHRVLCEFLDVKLTVDRC